MLIGWDNWMGYRRAGTYTLFKRCHPGNKEHGCELDGAFHIEVANSERLQELLEGQLVEAVVLILSHLQKPGYETC
jgi:hypothetical protein